MLIAVTRKPIDGTVAANCLKHGTGALNIDACRIAGSKPEVKNTSFESWRSLEGRADLQPAKQVYDAKQGRWPANVLHDGSPRVLARFPEVDAGVAVRRNVGISTKGMIPFANGPHSAELTDDFGYGDSGSASRFFKQVEVK